MSVVLGLDLSLTSAGAVILSQALAKPLSMTTGYALPKKGIKGQRKEPLPERARLDRLIQIATHLVTFAKANGVTAGFVENYAFNRPYQAAHCGELGGVVKCQFFVNLGIVLQPVTVSSARKFMCGKIPASANKKTWVQKFLANRNIEFDSLDESDAYVIANWGMNAVGLPAISSEEE